jgi:polyisoprenoid-binding protein YceI
MEVVWNFGFFVNVQSVLSIDNEAGNADTAPMRLAVICILVSALIPSVSPAQEVPVFAITPAESTIKFDVEASIAIAGTFEKWNATLTFKSPDVTTAALDVEIQAASVNTGSGLKDSKLRSGDFFDVENNPLITFKSTTVVQTGANTFELDGNFTIRGSPNPKS